MSSWVAYINKILQKTNGVEDLELLRTLGLYPFAVDEVLVLKRERMRGIIKIPLWRIFFLSLRLT